MLIAEPFSVSVECCLKHATQLHELWVFPGYFFPIHEEYIYRPKKIRFKLIRQTYNFFKSVVFSELSIIIVGTTTIHVPPWRTYPKIGDNNFKGALWTFKQQLAFKMRVRYGVFIVLLLKSSHKIFPGYVDKNYQRVFGLTPFEFVPSFTIISLLQSSHSEEYMLKSLSVHWPKHWPHRASASASASASALMLVSVNACEWVWCWRSVWVVQV